MKKQKLLHALILGALTFLTINAKARSIYRPLDEDIPMITTRWLSPEEHSTCNAHTMSASLTSASGLSDAQSNAQTSTKSHPDSRTAEKTSESSKTYSLKSWYLSESALFKTFDKKLFFERFLPQSEINYRYEQKSVPGSTLDTLINELVEEIVQSTKPRKEYRNFVVLKNRDFNHRTHSGLIVLKFKNYPFVVKLFMETPQTFVRPYSKGFQPSCFFILGKGINRYLAGFTRIKNQDFIRTQINNDPELMSTVDMPRKWFWQPANNRWFELKGTNIGPTKDHVLQLPSIYALVCDKIDGERTLDFFNKDDRELGMSLTHKFNNRLDPHIDNFIIEKDTKKIIIIDTEHFASIVGLREPQTFDNYLSWYTKLASKFLSDALWTNKKERIQEQLNPIPDTLIV